MKIEDEFDPEAGDIATTDYRRFYQYGKLWMQLSEDESDEFGEHITRQMDLDGFFPNVFFISDHGNVHQLLTK